jgi:hypothetical protein
MRQFDLPGKESLPDEMIVHFNVLCPRKKNKVFRELNAAEVVAIDLRRIRHLLMQELE